MPSPYDDIIDDLAKNDPEFLKLSPDQQDSLVESLAQEKMGKIPSSNAILNRAAKDITPMWSGADAPAVAFQTAQGLVQNAPQNIVENPITAALSGLPGVQAKAGSQLPSAIASLFGVQNRNKPETTAFSDKYLEPKSMIGKVAGTVGNIATGFVNPMRAVAPVAGNALESINPLSTMIKQNELPAEAARAMQTLKGLQVEDIAPLEQKIEKTKGMQELISSRMPKETPSIKGSKVNKASMDDIIFGGKEEISQKMLAKGKEYTDAFGEGFKKLDSTMTKGNFAEIAEKTIDTLGPETQLIPGTPANKIKNFLDKFLKEDMDPEELMSPEAVQAATKALKGALSGDINSQIKFNQNLIESLPETVPGLKELKAEYAPKFATMLGAKKYLTSSGISKVASGTAGSLRKAKMSKYAGEIGSEAVKKAEAFARGSKEEADMASKVAKEFQLRADEVNQVGKEALAKLGQKLDAYGEERASIISGHKAEVEDLMNMFRDAREALGKERIEKYKRLAIIGSLLSTIGLGKVRNFIKERF